MIDRYGPYRQACAPEPRRRPSLYRRVLCALDRHRWRAAHDPVASWGRIWGALAECRDCGLVRRVDTRIVHAPGCMCHDCVWGAYDGEDL